MHKSSKKKVAVDSDELWILSVPGENSTADSQWQQLNDATQTSGTLYSQNFQVELPELKVGTLDQLVTLADDLQKTDIMADRVCHKIVSYFEAVLDKDKDSLSENLVVGNNYDPFTYATKFKWDLARFPARLPLQGINAMIMKRTSQIENELKSRSSAFDLINQKIQAELKSHKGNLLTKDVSTMVKESDFVVGSETMKTALVCVSKTMYQAWFDNYETLSSMVVPRSSRLIAEDSEYGLFAVIIFRKVEDSFIYGCRQKGFYVKPFEYDKDSIASRATQFKELEAERSHVFGPLVRWLKVNFSESFIDWMHVKMLRVYVESVLRYGLPINFHVFILQPNTKTSKKLTDILDKLYSKMGNGPPSSHGSKKHHEEDMGILNVDFQGEQPSFRSYVMFTMNLNLVTALS